MPEQPEVPTQGSEVREPLSSRWAIVLLVLFVVTVGRFLEDVLHWPHAVSMLLPFAAALLGMYGVTRSPLMSFQRWVLVSTIAVGAVWALLIVAPDLLRGRIGAPLALALPLFAVLVLSYWFPPLIGPPRRAPLPLFLLIVAVAATVIALLAKMVTL